MTLRQTARAAMLDPNNLMASVETHLATLALAALLIAVALIDARTLRIPDWLNVGVAVAGLIATFVLGRDFGASLIGIGAGYAALFLINWGYRTLRGHDGIGLGDAKLLAGAGAWLGWSGLPFVVLLASSLGLAFVALDRVRGRKVDRLHVMPFGPFLCIGVVAVWLVYAYA